LITPWNTDNEEYSITGLMTWNGSSWTSTQITTQAGGGNQWTEIAVLRSLLASRTRTQLHLSMWHRPAW